MLKGLLDPNDLVRMLLSPAASTTARTAPPAITPVPGPAGFSSTWPAPKRPMIVCGSVPFKIGTVNMAFSARSFPLRIASGTSFALPWPTPTRPRSSPTTTIALKEKRRPPLTTFATRLTCTPRSISSWRSDARGRFTCARSELTGRSSEDQASFACALGEGTNAAACVAVAVSVKDHAGDARCDAAFGQRTADFVSTSHFCVAFFAREVFLDRRRRSQGYATRVANDLRVDVLARTENAEARTFNCPDHLAAHSTLTT